MRTLKTSMLSPAKKQGMAAYNRAGNQQKNLYASGQIPQSMKDAASYGGGWSPAYDNVLKTSRNAWAKWKPAANLTEYQARIDQKTAWPNMSLAGKQPSKLSKAPTKTGTTNRQGNAYSGQSTVKPPKYISDSTTEDAAGNVMAAGYQQADPRYQTKKLTKAGISNGAGQQFMAGQEGVNAMSKAAGQAADIRSQDWMANSKMRSDYEQLREFEALQKSMLQHQMSQSSWSRKFAEEAANAQLEMSYQQALQNLRMSLLS